MAKVETKELIAAREAMERYNNQIDTERFDSITEERRYRQAMMAGTIAIANMLETIATIQFDTARIAYLNKPE
jgi:hypothetical protein